MIEDAVEARLWSVRASREETDLAVLTREHPRHERRLGVGEPAQEDRLVTDSGHEAESSLLAASGGDADAEDSPIRRLSDLIADAAVLESVSRPWNSPELTQHEACERLVVLLLWQP